MDDIDKLDLNLLRLIDVLQQVGNLSAAARQLGISQPTASANLSKLRQFFGDQLYIRTGRGMRPTPLAEQITPAVRASLQIIRREITARTAFDPATSNRLVRITTSDVGVLIFVPPLLKALRECAPGVNLRVVHVPHDRLESALEQNEVDLAIGYFPDLQGHNIFTQSLFDHPFTCLIGARHPVIGDVLTLDAFLAADHIAINEQGRSQEIFERRLRDLGLSRRVVLDLPHFMSVPQLVANSEMIATVPHALGAWYAGPDLKILPPPFDLPLIQLRQFWHRRMADDPVVSWLRRLVARILTGADPGRALLPNYAGRTGTVANL